MSESPAQKFIRETSEAFTTAFTKAEKDLKPVITAFKASAYLPVSKELLMDEGVIPDTRPKTEPPKTTWRPRFYWWRQRMKERLAFWLFEKLAGYPVPDPDDYR